MGGGEGRGNKLRTMWRGDRGGGRRERAGEEGRGRKEGRKQAKLAGCPPKGRLRPLAERRPHRCHVLQGTGAQAPPRRPLGLPSPTPPGLGLKAREEAVGGRPGEGPAGPGPGRQPARPRARAGEGGSARGCPGPRGWQSSPRHAQTVKAGQGEVGGGSLGFYLRCNSLAEDCS